MIRETQRATRGLKLAAAKGLGVVVMEPLMGGRLRRPPENIRQTMESFGGAAVSGGVGAGLAVGSAGSFRGAERDEHHEPGGRKPALRRGFADRDFRLAEQELIAQVREQYSARTVIPAPSAATACRAQRAEHFPQTSSCSILRTCYTM